MALLRWNRGGRKVVCEIRDEALELPNGAGIDAVADSRSVDGAPDEPGDLELLKVLGHRRLSQWKLLDDLAADAGLTREQQSKDGHPCRVSEGLGQPGERFDLLGLSLQRDGFDGCWGATS